MVAIAQNIAYIYNGAIGIVSEYIRIVATGNIELLDALAGSTHKDGSLFIEKNCLDKTRERNRRMREQIEFCKIICGIIIFAKQTIHSGNPYGAVGRFAYCSGMEIFASRVKTQ